MRIGVTGSRTPRTPVQLAAVRDFLESHAGAQRILELHHGDCTGADEEVAEIARELGYRIISHPPIETKHRAFVPSYLELTPNGYHERNHDIVNSCDVLLVVPNGPEHLRSGTWSTARFARLIGREGTIIYPDGELDAL
jgi:thiamine pyrophosphate-dependent acetolactate synthase large subunit-like protein